MASNHFEMYAGDSKVLRVVVLNEQGLPADITGSTVRWQMATHVGAAPVVQKSTEAPPGGVTITDAVAGRFDVNLLPIDTEARAGCFYFEAEAATANTTSTVLVGSVDVKASLIKPA